MKRLFVIIILLLPCFLVKAQDKDLFQQRRGQEEIESRKIAHLATAITLTPVEAAQFWPVYNEWSKKLEANMGARHAALRQIRQLSRAESADEKIYAQQTKILIDGAAEEARIIADAHQAYLSILGVVRTAKLYLAEEQFRNILIRELRQSSEGAAGKPK